MTLVIRTRRGKLTIHDDGTIEGLWELLRRELRTSAQVRKMGRVTRKTFGAWRARRGFPEPVLSFPAPGGRFELWSRTEVEAWLERWHGLSLAEKRRLGGASTR
jgi:hypothetical protein